ncbi:MAG: 50S ribosomal protein L6 [Candidatus Shikimatogenerans sp. JK-2022]|nr:50S ribosomal protein L6 [Candidatus Shikimatogenerans bostrichidophilus]
MSKIGKKYIEIPKHVKIKKNKKKNKIYVIGKLGKLKEKIKKNIKIKIKNKKIYIINKKKNKKYKSLHGLYRMLIYNMVYGVSKGYNKKLVIIGIGYNAEVSKDGHILILNLGYSHKIIFHVCKKVKIKIKEEGGNKIIDLYSIDKQLLGIVAYKIRSLKKPEPYKGKGIRYLNEKIIIKTGKTV